MATKKPTASKTTAPKKPVAKKAVASTKSTAAAKPKPAATKATTATKAPVKKAPVKKAPVKKAPVKKAAAATPAAKKPAARKTAPAKAAPAKAATATKPKPAAKAPAAKRKPKAPTKYAFDVGDKVVYPHHGAATIIKKERIEFAGERRDYFVLEVATDQLTVRVPAESALERGVRPVISRNKAKQVFNTFKEPPQEAGSNWSRWYKLLTEKINSGDIFQVAEVIRDLTYAQQIKGISPALKRMLAKARLIIVSELQFTLDLDEDEAIKKLDRALPKVDVPDED